jgi:indolepyruvate ferredoxin oxidoreductase
MTTGKAYLDVRQALEDLGIDDALARGRGLRLYKVGMTWPLEPRARALRRRPAGSARRRGEARSSRTSSTQLYNWRGRPAPAVIGKFDESGAWILPSEGELTPTAVARW